MQTGGALLRSGAGASPHYNAWTPARALIYVDERLDYIEDRPDLLPLESPAFSLNPSNNITDGGANTTAQLTAPAGKTASDFGGGRIQDDENPTDDVDVPLNDYREDEWSLFVNALAETGATYEFRVVRADGTVLDTYTVTPQLTVGAGGTDVTIDVTTDAAISTTNQANVTSTAQVTATVQTDVSSTAAVATTNSTDVSSNAAVQTTNSTDVSSTAAVTATVQADVTSTAQITTTNQTDVTSDTAVSITATADVTSTAQVTTTNQTDVTSDGSISGNPTADVTSDAAITATVSADVSSTAAVSIAVQADVTSTAQVTVTAQADVTSTAQITTTNSTDVTTNASVDAGSTHDVPTDAQVTTTNQTDVTSTAQVTMTVQADVTSTAQVTTTNQADVASTAQVTATAQTDVTSTAQVTITVQADVTSTAQVTTTNQTDVSSNASVQLVTDVTLDVTTTAAIQAPVSRDVSSSAAVTAPVTLDVPTSASLDVYTPSGGRSPGASYQHTPLPYPDAKSSDIEYVARVEIRVRDSKGSISEALVVVVGSILATTTARPDRRHSVAMILEASATTGSFKESASGDLTTLIEKLSEGGVMQEGEAKAECLASIFSEVVEVHPIEQAIADLMEVTPRIRDLNVQIYEDEIARIWSAIFREQGRDLLTGLRKNRHTWPVQESGIVTAVLDALWVSVTDGTSRSTLERLRRALLGASGQGLQDEAMELMRRQFDHAFAVQHPRAVAYAAVRAAEMVTQINDETRDQIRGIMERAIESGQGWRETERQIKVRFEDFAEKKPQKHIQTRARLVARTESAMAYAAGQAALVDEMRVAGVAMEKSWLTVHDSRVSDGCRTNEAAGWIGVEEPFPSGHLHHPRFPGCRCTELYRVARLATV